jgi:hypothetical protein
LNSCHIPSLYIKHQKENIARKSKKYFFPILNLAAISKHLPFLDCLGRWRVPQSCQALISWPDASESWGALGWKRPRQMNCCHTHSLYIKHQKENIALKIEKYFFPFQSPQHFQTLAIFRLPWPLASPRRAAKPSRAGRMLLKLGCAH